MESIKDDVSEAVIEEKIKQSNQNRERAYSTQPSA
jgi:hypothetical protein